MFSLHVVEKTALVNLPSQLTLQLRELTLYQPPFRKTATRLVYSPLICTLDLSYMLHRHPPRLVLSNWSGSYLLEPLALVVKQATSALLSLSLLPALVTALWYVCNLHFVEHH